jgi:hypothetical protein
MPTITPAALALTATGFAPTATALKFNPPLAKLPNYPPVFWDPLLTTYSNVRRPRRRD